MSRTGKMYIEFIHLKNGVELDYTGERLLFSINKNWIRIEFDQDHFLNFNLDAIESYNEVFVEGEK